MSSNSQTNIHPCVLTQACSSNCYTHVYIYSIHVEQILIKIKYLLVDNHIAKQIKWIIYVFRQSFYTVFTHVVTLILNTDVQRVLGYSFSIEKDSIGNDSTVKI